MVTVQLLLLAVFCCDCVFSELSRPVTFNSLRKKEIEKINCLVFFLRAQNETTWSH